MRSNRSPQSSHSYSYMGISVSYRLRAQGSRLRASLSELLTAPRCSLVGAHSPITSMLAGSREYQDEGRRFRNSTGLGDRIDEICGIERAALSLAARGALFQKRFVSEEPHALLDRHVFYMQADAYDETGQPDKRFGELPKPQRLIVSTEARLDHHLLAV